MRRSLVIIFGILALASLLVLSVACTSTTATDIPDKTTVNDQANTISYSIIGNTSKPDRVELIYFHKQDPCHCMAVVGDNIQYAVDTYFKDEQAGGKVELTMVVSDDPANAELMKKYNAMHFSLFVKEIYGNVEKVYPVNDIWNMTGEDNADALINFIKTMLNDALEGKSS